MKATLLPYFALTCSATSTTGPQTRLWQSCGVANTSTIGFLPSTSAKLTSCMSLGGTRVSILERLPATSVLVGVVIRGGLVPTSGGRSLALAPPSVEAAVLGSRLASLTAPTFTPAGEATT